jgi:hypothetical protein
VSIEFYRILHFIGIFLVMSALGATVAVKDEGAVPRGPVAAAHGVGLLLLLVSGFGMLAKLGIGAPPPWALAKLGVWLVLGAMLAVARRRPDMRTAMFFAAPVWGAIAAWLAIFKPF